MNPGEMDQRVTIQRVTRVSDGAGGYTESWSDLATVWAKVEPLSGRERVHAMQVQAGGMYRFTIRRRSDITADMRLVWGGKTMNIRHIALPSTRAMYMEIDAEEGVET